MRFAGLLVLALGCSTAAPAKQIITIDRDAIPEIGTQGRVIEKVGDVAIVEIDDSELEGLSERMHTAHARCGGFALHESVADAEAFLVPMAQKPIEYTIDKPETVKAVLGQLDDKRILATIRELSGMKNRYYRSESGAAASAWLRERWKSFTTRTDVTVELFDHGYPQKSVIMTIPGTTHPDEIVVIGGHLDSIAPGGNTSNAPGADDDASGIATLTEIARVLLASDFRPERTIQFMAYAAEEVGLRGSLSIVKDYGKRKINVVGALQLDMTNYQGSNRDIWLIDDFTSKPQNLFLSKLIERYTDATWGSDVCGYACSDHASWHRAGVPASLPFESRSGQMNRHIHTPKDTLEQSGDNASHAVKFARLGAAYAIELAKGDVHSPAATETVATSGGGWSWKWIGLGLVGLAGLARLIRRRA